MSKERILVVDDEESLCEILKFNLEKEGYQVDVAYCAEEVLAMDLSVYNLFLLDVMMGKISGFQLANIIKSNKRINHVPIIFCTAKDQENDTMEGFAIGADDYISKPFSLNEVKARVKAVLRRSGMPTKQEEIKHPVIYKNLCIDVENKKVNIEKNEIALTKKEFEILLLLLQQPEKVFSREDLLKMVWPDDVYVTDRTVDVHITRLRKKIVPYDKNITTRTGYGYSFQL